MALIDNRSWNDNINLFIKEVSMKPGNFVNPITKEQWICDDITKIKTIDGVSYIQVHKPDSYRKVLMRKDSLQKVVKFKR